MKCGYCTQRAIAWIEWRTIGRPKGAPVCEAHLCERDRCDNWNDRLTVVAMLNGTFPAPRAPYEGGCGTLSLAVNDPDPDTL